MDDRVGWTVSRTGFVEGGFDGRNVGAFDGGIVVSNCR